MKDKKQVVIYGAGGKASFHYTELIEKGMEVVAFCDKDENKIGKTIYGLPILSKKQVKEKYNDFVISISVIGDLKIEIQDELIDEGFIKKENIINYEIMREGLYCRSLFNTAIIDQNNIYSCCLLGDLRGQIPYIAWDTEDIDGSIDKFLKYRTNLIKKIQNGEQTACNNCSELVNTRYSINTGGGGITITIVVKYTY